MTGRPPEKPEAVREYLIEQVCDQRGKLKPLVDAINEGKIEGLPKVSFSYSTARRWIDTENRLRDAIAPLEDEALDGFDQRLMAIGRAELRKLERDSRKPQSVDAKRLNELQAFSARMRRQLNRGAEDPQATNGVSTTDQPESMLDRLAREELDNTKRSSAASTPHPPKPKTETSNPQGKTVDQQAISENVKAIPVHVAA